MDSLLFGAKRAYHATLRLTREPLGRLGLTPARFDLLHALFRTPARLTYQSSLRRALGVARSTVSRMLKSLEAIGLVRRERETLGDRRDRLVYLTKEGRRRVRRALFSLVHSGHIGLALDSALTPSGRRWPHERHCARARQRLAQLHGRLRVALGDFACLYPADARSPVWSLVPFDPRAADVRRRSRAAAFDIVLPPDPERWPSGPASEAGEEVAIGPVDVG